MIGQTVLTTLASECPTRSRRPDHQRPAPAEGRAESRTGLVEWGGAEAEKPQPSRHVGEDGVRLRAPPSGALDPPESSGMSAEVLD